MVTTVMPIQQRGEDEILLFADASIKDELVKALQTSDIKINKSSYSAGMPLRITSGNSSRDFFEIPLKMWRKYKERIRITFRLAGGRTFELNDQTANEVEKMISQMRSRP